MMHKAYKLAGIIVLCAAILVAWVWRDYDSYLNTPIQMEPQESVFPVRPGSHLKSVIKELSALGILRSPGYFEWYARVTGLASKIKAGEYRLTSGMTPIDLMALLVSGKSISYSLTLIEGWNFRQVRAAIDRHPEIKKTLSGMSDAEVMDHLGFAGLHPEGRFYPDTYLFPKNSTDASLLKRAFSRMESILAEAWKARAGGLPLSSSYEALILASIIERETGAAKERGQIAGVFVRRLRKGMRLQTDPTVIYGMGEDFDGNIRRKDLKKDTAYNTYVHKGLPPTPISMPGGDSIRAAVHPSDDNSLYFVAKGNGEHYFSSTLEQHNSAVRKYQLKR